MVNHPNRSKNITRTQAVAALKRVEVDLDALLLALRKAEAGNGLATWGGNGGDAASAAERVGALAYGVASLAGQLDQ